jgi:dephospho-CoA kinase
MRKIKIKHTRFSKPVIGLVGGIGAGKSFVAGEFAKNGCAVIHSDELGHAVLEDPAVIAQLVAWWGDQVLDGNGRIVRKRVAEKVFDSPAELVRLQQLMHPKIAILRDKMMHHLVTDKKVIAIVFDSPLLIETGLNKECEAIIFINTSKQARLARVAKSRGWDAAEVTRRENFQMALDKKRQFADYTIDNDGDLAHCAGQVRDVLSRVLASFVRSNQA